MENPGYYIGPLGALIWLPDAVGRLERAIDERNETVKTMVDGTRRVWRTPNPRRAWEVSIPRCDPHEYASLVELSRWGRPPYVWVDPDAATHNLALPSWGAGNGGGIIKGVDGTTHWRSYLYGENAGAVTIVRGGVPVLPGVPVTASAYVRAHASKIGYMWAQMLDAAGNPLGPTQSAGTTNGSTAVRLSTTFPNPPVNAVSIRVGHTDAAQVTGIAVTWTKSVTSYKPGMGCDKAYFTGLSDTITEITEDRGGASLANVSFRVVEVG